MRTLAQQYIDGRWRPASGAGATRLLINPATEQAVVKIGMAARGDVEYAVAAARRAFIAYSSTPAVQRAALIQRLIAVYRRRYDELALAITIETGAPYEQSAKQLQVRAGLRYLEAGAPPASARAPQARGAGTTRLRAAAGVCALITPRHDAVGHIVRGLVAAIVSGCALVLKPSNRAPLSAQLLAEIVDEAGVPDGMFNLVFGSGAELGRHLTLHPYIDRVSFAGSAASAGRVAREVADAIKPLSLAICRRSVDIALDDVPVDDLIARSVHGAMVGSGHSSEAASRLLVPLALFDQAVAVAAETARQLVVGDPLDMHTTIGPLSSAALFQRMQETIATGISQGAEVLAGGLGRPADLYQGYYARPTVLTARYERVRESRYDESGPLLTLIAYRDEQEAVAIANDAGAGSVCRIWSRDAQRARAAAHESRASVVLINDAGCDAQTGLETCRWQVAESVRNDGIQEFTQCKTIIGTIAA